MDAGALLVATREPKVKDSTRASGEYTTVANVLFPTPTITPWSSTAAGFHRVDTVAQKAKENVTAPPEMLGFRH
eukprot:11224904-Lingulodinium_polyedra.AAC.1